MSVELRGLEPLTPSLRTRGMAVDQAYLSKDPGVRRQRSPVEANGVAVLRCCTSWPRELSARTRAGPPPRTGATPSYVIMPFPVGVTTLPSKRGNSMCAQNLPTRNRRLCEVLFDVSRELCKVARIVRHGGEDSPTWSQTKRTRHILRAAGWFADQIGAATCPAWEAEGQQTTWLDSGSRWWCCGCLLRAVRLVLLALALDGMCSVSA
jgi:hypothetical protein